METTYVYRPDKEECIAIFVASCIETAAKALNCSTAEAYIKMDNVGLIKDYIIPCYDVLHAESRENVTKDILYTLNLWEKKKGVTHSC